MTTANMTIVRPRVSLKIPRRVPDLITYANRVVTDMTGNAAFPSPTPALAVIMAAVHDLTVAQSAALTRAAGAAAARNEKRAALVTLLQQLGGCIQTAADASPENGASIIQSAGVTVRKAPTRAKRTFAAVQGDVSGAVKVTAALASRRAAYDWEYSLDGGKTWVATPTTLQAKTTITGLPAGTTVQFRHRAATKSGEGDWSVPTSLMVK